MTSNAGPGSRVLGRLGVADGTGVVRVEDRYDTDIDDLWSSITDPERLARWYGKVEGDLRLGGAFTLYLESADLNSIGRVDTCEPPRRLRITTRESDESARRGNGPPPFEQTVEATLTAAGPQTVLTIEIRGLPLDKIEYFGAGWQIHAENLAAYLAHQESTETESRWSELVTTYRQLASTIR
ncbi:SRPBCC family protein [Kribbella sp. NBC_01484]|uniref:SRPBCC family protein n=1 Tax=Kribbella sp. NBC_01484 TaxID=2903579 RepID=UPI002E34AB83|nr:SRPBCC family protein [Kribbella sp. NBC_01484]